MQSACSTPWFHLFPPFMLCLLAILAASPVWAQATLENPQPDSFQSGIGVISGWACNAERIEITFNGGPPQEAAYGTSRGDTAGTCGDTDNGFGLLFNWNLLGDGAHTVQALADGVEFATATVIVTTLGTEFRRGARGEVSIPDFPTPGQTLTLRWQQTQQNFVITDGSSSRGGGTSGAPPQVLENPAPGSFQSGLGLISGWVCDAQTITISFDGGPPQEAAYGTSRGDTEGTCGDTDNGFGLLFNWNLLGDGPHTVTASADGIEFARVDVTVTTLGTEFWRGLSLVVGVPDFPQVGTDVVLQWQEAQQNFVIIRELPTQRLVEVTPTVALPAGVRIPNLAVTSLYSETAAVRASPEPTLLLAEDADGIVLLGLANMDGGLLGDSPGEAEVSVASTVVTLVGLVAGISVTSMTSGVVDEIINHPHYLALHAALSAGLASDPHFLANIGDDAELVRLIEAIAADLGREATSHQMEAANAPLASSSKEPAPSGMDRREGVLQDPLVRILELLAECDRDLSQDTPERARLIASLREIGVSWLKQVFWIEPIVRLGEGIGIYFAERSVMNECLGEEERRWQNRNPDDVPGNRLLSKPAATNPPTPKELVRRTTIWLAAQQEWVKTCRARLARDEPAVMGADVLSVLPVEKLLRKLPVLGPVLAEWYGKWSEAQRAKSVRDALTEAQEAVEEYCSAGKCVIDKEGRGPWCNIAVTNDWLWLPGESYIPYTFYCDHYPSTWQRDPLSLLVEGREIKLPTPTTCQQFVRNLNRYLSQDREEYGGHSLLNTHDSSAACYAATEICAHQGLPEGEQWPLPD